MSPSINSNSGRRALGKHAVVIGGSIGGLLSGRVLSQYFDQVTIVERDSLPETIEPRKGVPQGRHGRAGRVREVGRGFLRRGAQGRLSTSQGPPGDGGPNPPSAAVPSSFGAVQ